MPEIIEDLCEDVRLASGLELLPVFEERWKPAVVKFTAPADSPDYAVAIALCYLREVALLGRPGHGAVWCFDGHNKAVPADRIVAVEWVGDPAQSWSRSGSLSSGFSSSSTTSWPGRYISTAFTSKDGVSLRPKPPMVPR